jgi:hypothetical protein
MFSASEKLRQSQKPQVQTTDLSYMSPGNERG